MAEKAHILFLFFLFVIHRASDLDRILLKLSRPHRSLFQTVLNSVNSPSFIMWFKGPVWSLHLYNILSDNLSLALQILYESQTMTRNCSLLKVPKTQLHFLFLFPLHLQVLCGRKPCLLQKRPGLENHHCPAGQKCQEHNFFTCFSPPCHEWGVCSAPEPPVPINTQCQPHTGYLDNSCARITLIFNKDKVPQVSPVIK